MIAAPKPRAVDIDDLPEYPLDQDVRLSSHYFTMIEHHRWLNSALRLSSGLEVQGAALNLYFIAQSQTPVGTLPDDDAILSRLLYTDLVTWQALRNRPFGALHHWTRCRCGSEIRLMHPVVLEGVLNALNRRETREASKDDRAVVARMQRLKEALVKMGCAKDVVGDDVLLERMEAWLFEHWKRRRTPEAYIAVLEYASKMKWFGGSARH